MHGIPLAHEESEDITMNRALGVLNGQILTRTAIEPGSRTRLPALAPPTQAVHRDA